MNAPSHDRARTSAVLSVVGERYGLRISGLLPTGCVSHERTAQPVVFLAERLTERLSLLELCAAEVDVEDELGVASRILLRDELAASPGGAEILAGMRPL